MGTQGGWLPNFPGGLPNFSERKLGSKVGQRLQMWAASALVCAHSAGKFKWRRQIEVEQRCVKGQCPRQMGNAMSKPCVEETAPPAWEKEARSESTQLRGQPKPNQHQLVRPNAPPDTY